MSMSTGHRDACQLWSPGQIDALPSDGSAVDNSLVVIATPCPRNAVVSRSRQTALQRVTAATSLDEDDGGIGEGFQDRSIRLDSRYVEVRS